MKEPAFQRFVAEARTSNYEKMRSTFDPSYGGFGPPPRFAPHQSLDFLIRYAQRQRSDRFGKQREALAMITTTLDHLLAGGMHDQLGDGIHRYSTGIPRLVNALADKCLLAAFVQKRDRVSFNMVGTAIRELEGRIRV